MYDAYAIVNGKGKDFNDAQNSLANQMYIQMKKGWIPLGGVIFTGIFTEPDGSTYLVFSQAIVRQAKE